MKNIKLKFKKKRKLMKQHDSYIITLPPDWAEQVGGKGTLLKIAMLEDCSLLIKPVKK